MTADALTDEQRRQALPIVDAGRVVGPGHRGRRRGCRAVDGARPLGLGRRHGHDRAVDPRAAPSASC